MNDSVTAFDVSGRYSNEQIYKSLGVGNTGGVRVKKDAGGKVRRIVLFTSIPTARQVAENPYQDRLEGDILIYTGAGKFGEQSVSGANARILEQDVEKFPIYAFVQIAGRRDASVGIRRWRFLGLLEYLRGYQERQVDSNRVERTVWVFEFKVYNSSMSVLVEKDCEIMRECLVNSSGYNVDDREVVARVAEEVDVSNMDLVALEDTRRRLLAYSPKEFEHVVSDILKSSGFEEVEVTRYSQDGGIDINARLGRKSWPLRHLLTQIQAKRWLHTVGRKEVAELRGSLQPYAAGCVVTTSHFSKAAVLEAAEPGKLPITIVDGYELARIVKHVELNKKKRG